MIKQIVVSGESYKLEDVHSLPQLFKKLGIDSNTNGMAIARNGTIVRRSDFELTNVEDGDRIEIVRASQGG